MATATAMYHSGMNPLKGISRDPAKGEKVDIVRGERRRRLHKAFLRYHDPNNWPLLRDALKEMGRADLIGNGKHHLIPTFQPATDGAYQCARRKNSTAAGAKTSVAKPMGKASAAPAGKAAPGFAKPAGAAARGPAGPGGVSAKGATVAKGGVSYAKPAGQAPRRGTLLTQHTGLPPRETGARPGASKAAGGRKGR
jgi:hypothetical protein